MVVNATITKDFICIYLKTIDLQAVPECGKFKYITNLEIFSETGTNLIR